MKQILNSRGKIMLEDVPTPVAEPGKILVKTAYSCISPGTELSGLRASATPLWRKAMDKPQHVKKVLEMASQQGIGATIDAVRSKVGTPTPLGYSAAGTVIAVGDGVTEFQTGDLVACAGAQCAHHAEVLAIPTNLAVHIPENVSAKDASTVALGAIALQGVRRVEPTIGETVMVIGLGILGQLATQILRASGCKTIGVDLDSTRLEQAKKLGLDHAVSGNDDLASTVFKLTEGVGADAVLITASGNSPEILSTAFKASRKRGRVVLVGDVPLEFKREDLYEKELDFRISTSYGPGRYDFAFEERGQDYPVAYVRWTETRNMSAYLELLASGKVKSLVAKDFPLENAEEAFQQLGNKETLVAALKYSDEPIRESQKRKEKAVEVHTGNTVALSIIGAGSFVENVHLPNLVALKNKFSLQTITNRTGHKATNIKNRFSAKTASANWREVLDSSSTEAVLIATRHDQHAELAEAFLRGKKHVFLEKPIALSQKELNNLRKLFETEKNLPIFFTGYNRRFSPAARKLKSLLSERESPVILNYQMNAGFLPKEHWVHGPEGGGRNIGEACHIYDLFVYLLGKPKSTQAAGIGGNHAPFTANDNFVATFHFADGSVATLTYTALGNPSLPKETMTAFFDGKVFTLNDYKSSTYSPSAGKTEEEKYTSKGHKEELEEFWKAISSDQSVFPIEEQLLSAQIALDVEQKLGSR